MGKKTWTPQSSFDAGAYVAFGAVLFGVGILVGAVIGVLA